MQPEKLGHETMLTISEPSLNARRPEKLQVIFKTVERCNLACGYCYYFFGGDQSYKEKPAVTSREVADLLAKFLVDGVRDMGLARVEIIFHGGEPLLQKKADFDYACDLFRRSLSGLCELRLAVQSNGTKFDPDWADLFVKHSVRVGISLDGPREVNDTRRPDHKGRGSYDTIVRSLDRLRPTGKASFPLRVGCVTVLDAQLDYEEVVTHFYEHLGLRNIGFLLPDCTHDSGIPGGQTAIEYGRVLCNIFDVWTGYTDLSIREVSKVLSFFQAIRLVQNAEHPIHEKHPANECAPNVANQIIVVRSDGTVEVDDSYIPAKEWRDMAPKTILGRGVDLFEDLQSPFFFRLDAEKARLPAACVQCVWARLCRGGDLENRFSTECGFDNPSVFCDGLKIFYEHVVRYLVRNGYPKEEIRRRLAPNSTEFIEHEYSA